MSFKFKGDLCVMTMNNDAKFKEELSCQFKTDIRNWTTFDLSTQKSQKTCTLMSCFWPRDIMFELKKAQRRYIWWQWKLMRNLKENWLVLSKVTWKIWQIFVYKLKNSNIISESKMRQLNQNKNSKQPDRPDVVWKLFFILEINE